MEYPSCTDGGWLLRDHKGQVAILITGGQGPIPRAVLEADAFNIEEVVYRLDCITSALAIRHNVAESFIEPAKRGLYVYDWSDVHRTGKHLIGGYELMCRPEQALRLENIPDELLSYLTILPAFNIGFDQAALLDVKQMYDCLLG